MDVQRGWILAIDLGNGGPKVAVVGLDGEIQATAFRGVSVTIELDGTATQDAEEWTEALVAAVCEAVETCGVEPSGLHSIGITGQWGSTVPVGADGHPVGPVMLWADTRAKKHMAQVIGGRLAVMGYAPHKVWPFLKLTGGAPNPNGADPTGHSLLLQNELAEIGRQTRVLLEPVDYLAFRLTGRAVATPASMCLSWLTDNRPGSRLGYSRDLIRRTRRDRTKLPQLAATGTVQGGLLPGMAAELGLRSGVPVICGIPDLHAAIVGSGSVRPYDSHLAVSTTAWFSARVPFKKTDVLHSIGAVPGLDPDHLIVANNVETGGAALTWLREQVIAPDDGLLGGGSGIGADGAAPPALQPTYDDLIRLAETAPPGGEGLIFMPWLAGERSPVDDKYLRAGWLNMSLRTDRAMLVRSVLEGVALNLRWLFGPYEKFLGRRVDSLRIMGGGAESDLWCSIIASTLDRRIEQVADPMHAQLRGVALWTRVALGELTLTEAADLVQVAKVFEPVRADRQIYDRQFQEYRKLYGKVKGMYGRLNADR
jgi:xylulokinase